MWWCMSVKRITVWDQPQAKTWDPIWKITKARSIGGSIYEYSIIFCTVSCWILGEYGDRERVSNVGLIWLKAQYIQSWSAKATPPWTINIHFKKKKKEKHDRSFPRVSTSGMGVDIRKGEWRWTWWIYFVFIYENRRMKSVEIVLRREWGGEEGERWRDSSKVYYRRICKYQNVSLCTTITC
jgi:hypothetical protein